MGSLRPRDARLFPNPRREASSIRRPPEPVMARAHPSPRSSSSEFLRAFTSPAIFRSRLHQPLGFRSLFATSLERSDVSSRSAPTPVASRRPRAFAAPRRFFPRSSSQACFIPQPRSGIRSFRGLLSPRSHPSSSEGACPLAVGTPSLSARSSLRRSVRAPRVVPLDFEASIRAGPRSESPVIHLAPGRSPLRVPCSSRSFVRDVGSGFPGAFRSWCSRARSSPCRFDLAVLPTPR
jgi:hypothetical protein